jgi:hypothetical protein
MRRTSYRCRVQICICIYRVLRLHDPYRRSVPVGCTHAVGESLSSLGIDGQCSIPVEMLMQLADTLNTDLTRSAAVKSDECSDASLPDTVVIHEYVSMVSSEKFILDSKRTRRSHRGNRGFILHNKLVPASCSRITSKLG